MKALAATVSGEKRLPGLETVVFSLCPHVVAEVWEFSGASCKGTSPTHASYALIIQAPPQSPTT